MSPRQAGYLLGLLIFSFTIRLGSIVATTGLHTPPRAGSDDAEYDASAWNLVQGNGYSGLSPDVVGADGQGLDHPTAYRPPTSVLYYAAVYAIAGHKYAAAHVANSALATLTVLLVFLITRRTGGTGAAWLAAVVYAGYPVALYYNLRLQSESLAPFLICLFVWLCLGFRGDRGVGWAIGAGLGLGLLLLCKPGYVFLLPLLPVWALVVCRNSWRLWLRAALIPVFAGVLVLPWTVRNYLQFGAFIPFGTGGGSLLLQANNRIVVADPQYHGYAVWDTSLPEYAAALRAPNDELERDAVAKRFAIEWLKQNHDKWFYLARGKFWRLWTPWYYGTSNRIIALLVCGYYGVILLGFLGALIPVTVRFVRERDPALIMQALIVATVVMAVVFHGQHRYRFPIDGLSTIIAAVGLGWAARRVSGKAGLDQVRPRIKASGMMGIGVILILSVAFAVACRIDEQRIRDYRVAIAHARLQAMAEAIKEYRQDTNQVPMSLEDLVPKYLPVVESLHCPTHTLEYHDYLLLGSRDAKAAHQVISYKLERLPGDGMLRIVQVKGAHLIETFPLGR